MSAPLFRSILSDDRNNESMVQMLSGCAQEAFLMRE